MDHELRIIGLLEQIAEGVGGLNKRLGSLEQCFGVLDRRVEFLEQRMSFFEQRIATVESYGKIMADAIPKLCYMVDDIHNKIVVGNDAMRG